MTASLRDVANNRLIGARSSENVCHGKTANKNDVLYARGFGNIEQPGAAVGQRIRHKVNFFMFFTQILTRMFSIKSIPDESFDQIPRPLIAVYIQDPICSSRV